ncbi:MAG TPA: CPBP family intramembrane glutamic endopeptidase [Phycisphaerae bacterium]|nr:CPBP family intramembrane glutamic endopeptidase [Phycisphaerae bacterium]
MTALALLAFVPLIMWLAQTALLKRHGLGVRWRLDSGDSPAVVREAGRIVTQVTLSAVAVAYPLLIGEGVAEYYARLLPLNDSMADFGQGAALATLFLSVFYLVWLVTDQVRVAPHLDRRRTMRKLAIVPFSAIFGALVEEIVFRGIVMADLLRSAALTDGSAVVLSAAIFAAAHYVRAVKRRWTILGHFMLGLMLCAAFLETGNLWLAAGLHAGGILVIMGARPVLKYRGPAWLTGASIFPYAGVVGIAGLATLTAIVSEYAR